MSRYVDENGYPVDEDFEDEDNFFDVMKTFTDAQRQAEKAGEEQFVCPLCGGEAWWGRSSYNNHLHCGCHGCGYLIMQ